MAEKSHSSSNAGETNKLYTLLTPYWKSLGEYTECVMESGFYLSKPTGRTCLFLLTVNSTFYKSGEIHGFC